MSQPQQSLRTSASAGTMTALLIALAVTVAVLVAGFIYHRIASHRDRRQHPPHGELVDIGGARLHVWSAGRGKPTVVLDSALAGTSLSWWDIHPRLAELTRVVSYDRVGFGWSDGNDAPRTVDNMVSELERLLESGAIESPYILVGHSYGGWVAQLYASRHRESVAGLVLVDAPHPREWMKPDDVRRKRATRGARLARRGAWCAHFGLLRLLSVLEHLPVFRERGKVRALLGKTPSAIHGPLKTFWVQPRTLEALASQIENAPQSAARVFEETRSLGDLPLVVLTASNPDSQRVEDQRETTALSSAGRHIVAEHSGHWIPLEEPDLIVDAVRDVVESIR